MGDSNWKIFFLEDWAKSSRMGVLVSSPQECVVSFTVRGCFEHRHYTIKNVKHVGEAEEKRRLR